MFTLGAVLSAIALAPVAVAVAIIIVAVMFFNLIVRELMLAAWDIATEAISDVEVFVKNLTSSEKETSVVKEAK